MSYYSLARFSLSFLALFSSICFLSSSAYVFLFLSYLSVSATGGADATSPGPGLRVATIFPYWSRIGAPAPP
jgi:hypothetical protein